MIINKDNIPLNINQLSSGEKTLLALIADLARRLAIANPHRDNPLMGNGVVLIDEVDLHVVYNIRVSRCLGRSEKLAK